MRLRRADYVTGSGGRGPGGRVGQPDRCARQQPHEEGRLQAGDVLPVDRLDGPSRLNAQGLGLPPRVHLGDDRGCSAAEADAEWSAIEDRRPRRALRVEQVEAERRRLGIRRGERGGRGSWPGG